MTLENILKTILKTNNAVAFKEVLLSKHAEFCEALQRKYGHRSLPELLYLHIKSPTKKPGVCQFCKSGEVSFNSFRGGYRLFCSAECREAAEEIVPLESILRTIKQKNSTRAYTKQLRRCYPTFCKRIIKKHNVRRLPEALYLELKSATGKKEICKFCSKKTTGFCNFSKGYKPYCSLSCAQKSEETNEKRKQALLDRYGVTKSMDVPGVKARVRATNLSRYGVPSPLHHSAVREKGRATSMKKYGVDYYAKTPMFKKRIKAKKEEIQQKREATFIRNLGVRSPAQVPEIHERQGKNSYRIKEVTVGGKVFRVRGYEPVMLKHLISIGIKPKNIKVSAKEGLPTVDYVYDGKSHRYFPDMLVKDGNRINLIEVKSVVTAGLQSDEAFNRLKAKLRAANKVYPTVLAFIQLEGKRYRIKMFYSYQWRREFILRQLGKHNFKVGLICS